MLNLRGAEAVIFWTSYKQIARLVVTMLNQIKWEANVDVELEGAKLRHDWI